MQQHCLQLSSDDDLDFTCEIPETYDILESNKLNSADQLWTGIGKIESYTWINIWGQRYDSTWYHYWCVLQGCCENKCCWLCPDSLNALFIYLTFRTVLPINSLWVNVSIPDKKLKVHQKTQYSTTLAWLYGWIHWWIFLGLVLSL